MKLNQALNPSPFSENAMYLITGAFGQLGTDLKDILKNNAIFASRQECDITDTESLNNFIKLRPIKLIINCAAYNAVDKAEDEKNAAYLVNSEGIKNLATICQELKIPLIHISTDYVFDGNNSTPYTETDHTNPKTIYGKSKLQGEKYIQDILEHYAIIRTSWLYSNHHPSFLTTMKKLGAEKKYLNVISDQIGTPTLSKDLAKIIVNLAQIIEKKYIKEIFHFSNEGICSWYDFAKEIMKIYNLDCKVHAIKGSEYPTKATRPSYSVLDKSKIKKFLNIKISPWNKSLAQCAKDET